MTPASPAGLGKPRAEGLLPSREGCPYLHEVPCGLAVSSCRESGKRGIDCNDAKCAAQTLCRQLKFIFLYVTKTRQIPRTVAKTRKLSVVLSSTKFLLGASEPHTVLCNRGRDAAR